KTMIDAVAGGSLMKKSASEGYEMIEEMARKTFSWHSERNRPRPVAAMYDPEAVSQLQAQMASLTTQLRKMRPSMDAIPQGDPPMTPMEDPYVLGASSSMEEVHLMGRNDRGTENFNPYSNTYNPDWRHHLNISWSNQNSQRSNIPPGF